MTKELQQMTGQVRLYFEQSRRGQKSLPFWTLKTGNTKHTRGKHVISNYEEERFEDALGYLLESIEQFAPNLDQWIFVELKNSKKDANPRVMSFKNLAYNGNTLSQYGGSKNPTIGGIPQQTYETHRERELLLLEKQYEERLKRMEEKYENERKMEYLEAEIAAIKEGNKTTVDKIGSLLNHPVVISVLTSIANKAIDSYQPPVTTQQTQSGVEQEMQNVAAQNQQSNPPRDFQEGMGEVSSDDTQMQSAQKLQQDLYDLETIFPEESLSVISELAQLAKTNPTVLKNLRPTLQDMVKKSQNE